MARKIVEKILNRRIECDSLVAQQSRFVRQFCCPVGPHRLIYGLSLPCTHHTALSRQRRGRLEL